VADGPDDLGVLAELLELGLDPPPWYFLAYLVNAFFLDL
jgi:hypothetical protein